MSCAAHAILDWIPAFAGMTQGAEMLTAMFNNTLKPKQPHPNPPLLTQGRERLLVSIKSLG
jgi:hypothetical protein